MLTSKQQSSFTLLPHCWVNEGIALGRLSFVFDDAMSASKNHSLMPIIKRLWRSRRYACIVLNAFETGNEARKDIGSCIADWNTRRPHSPFDGRALAETYAASGMTEQFAALKQTDPP